LLAYSRGKMSLLVNVPHNMEVMVICHSSNFTVYQEFILFRIPISDDIPT